jgi:hypothetical protein
MAEAKPPSREPWWEERGRVPEPIPDQAEAESLAPPAEAPPELSWVERREPFLKALSARIEPLEDVAVRIAADLSETRRELQAFVEETRRSLTQLASSVADLHRDASSRSDELASRMDRGTDRTVEALGRELAAAVDAVTGAVRESAGMQADVATNRIAESGREVLARIQALEDAVHQKVSEAEESTGERLAERDEALRTQVAAVEEAVRAGLGSLEEVFRSGLSAAARGADERVAGVRDDLRARLDEIDRDAAGRMDQAVSGIRETLDALAPQLQGGASRDDVDAVRAALEDAAGSIRTSVAESRRSVEHAVTQATAVLRKAAADERERLAARLSGPLDAVETGLARVDRLAGVIDSLSHRRGFRELVESEETLRREQAGFVDRLAETAGGMTERVDSLSTRLDALERDLRAMATEAAGLGRLPGEASERVAAAMEGVRASIEEGLDRRFTAAVDTAVRDVRAELERGVPIGDLLTRLEDVAGAQEVLAKAQHQVEGLADALRAEVVGLRTTVAAWGKPDTVPEVARRAARLEDRVAAVEETVARLGETVADRVTRQVLQALDQRRRGVFRR